MYVARISASLLPALSRVPEILPALGARALSQSDGKQQRERTFRHVIVSGRLPRTGPSASATACRKNRPVQFARWLARYLLPCSGRSRNQGGGADRRGSAVRTTRSEA